MLNVRAGVREMSKTGTMPFLIHTALKDRQQVLLGSTSAVPGPRQASSPPAGGHVPGHRAGTEPVGTSCMPKTQQACFQRNAMYRHFVRPCQLCHAGHYPGMVSAKGVFDVGRNEGPSLPDSRRKTGSLAPSFLPDSRGRSRRGCGMVSPETVRYANVLCPEDCRATPAPPPQRLGYRCQIRN